MMVNTEKLNYYKSRMFSGYDTDTTMLRIGAMNMLLHKIDDPNIQEQDSLSTENHDAERYSLILANPPFTGSLDKEVVSPTLKNLTKTNKTEPSFFGFIRTFSGARWTLCKHRSRWCSLRKQRCSSFYSKESG